MASWDDVHQIAMTLPETSESLSAEETPDNWRVRGKLYAWNRPLRKGDLEALGDRAPRGPILAARVPDVGVKEALVADDPAVYFTTPHFTGYAVILVRLDRISVADLRDLLVEAWLVQAPKRLAKEYLSSTGQGQPS
ncbi:MAG: MmcQ/YjbR family DNA-binding protein [Nocardioidaceae bacterium]